MIPKRLDSNGRCCGRKPLKYKRPHVYLFCDRCGACFDPWTGVEVLGGRIAVGRVTGQEVEGES